MSKSNYTPGPWMVGRPGCVVACHKTWDGNNPGGRDDEVYYKGFLIAESIARPADAQLMATAPNMLALLKQISSVLSVLPDGHGGISIFNQDVRGGFTPTADRLRKGLLEEINKSIKKTEGKL